MRNNISIVYVRVRSRRAYGIEDISSSLMDAERNIINYFILLLVVFVRIARSNSPVTFEWDENSIATPMAIPSTPQAKKKLFVIDMQVTFIKIADGLPLAIAQSARQPRQSICFRFTIYPKTHFINLRRLKNTNQKSFDVVAAAVISRRQHL